MRTIEDFTEADLLALSETEVNAIIDRECMARGIPLLPPEPVPPMEPCIEYDIIAYAVAGYDFQARADAEAVAAIINSKARAKYEYGSAPFYESEFSGWTVEERATVTEKPILSATQRIAKRSVREQHNAAKEEYDRRYKEYREILNQRSEVDSEVRDRWYSAHRKQRERDQHRANFERYVEMAGGDRDVARKFFCQAYGEEAFFDAYPEFRGHVEDAA